MIDIHPPQHAPMTKREFFIHLFIVVLGILIAIGLEQAVEYLHHRHLASEGWQSLLAERTSNQASNDVNIFATHRHQQDLLRDLAILHAIRAHQPVPAGPFIVRHVGYVYLEDDWHRLHQSGTINYLSAELHPIDYRYENQDAFMARSERSGEDLYRAASVLRTEHDALNATYEQNVAFSNFLKQLAAAHEALPQQEIDAAWATNAAPGNLAALSPTQIDSLERALQIALADDDAMLRDFFIHLGIVVLGILIAIGLEQAVEAIHSHHERQQLREALNQESRQILFDTQRVEAGETMNIAWIHQLEQQISDAQQSHHPPAPFPPRPRYGWDVPDEPTFKAAKAGGKLSLLSDNDIVAYGELDSDINQFALKYQSLLAAQKNVDSFTRDLAFGHAPGNPLANASPADLKQFYSDLVAWEVASLDTRYWGRQARGCAIALLNGERNLRKIEASERQFDNIP